MAATKKNNKMNDEIRVPLQALIARGRKDGTLPITELTAELEKLDLSVEKIEQIYEMLESMGIQDCIDIYQEAYDTYMASKG